MVLRSGHAVVQKGSFEEDRAPFFPFRDETKHAKTWTNSDLQDLSGCLGGELPQPVLVPRHLYVYYIGLGGVIKFSLVML